MANDSNEELPKLPKALKKELDSEEKRSAPAGNIWEKLRELKQKGLFKGEIETIVPKDFNISQSCHYYVIDDLRRRSIKCVSCNITHGGILEAHLLSRYQIKEGILYFDGEPTNKIPEGFAVDSS